MCLVKGHTQGFERIPDLLVGKPVWEDTTDCSGRVQDAQDIECHVRIHSKGQSVVFDEETRNIDGSNNKNECYMLTIRQAS